jgi:hypothetical protein
MWLGGWVMLQVYFVQHVVISVCLAGCRG